VPDVIQAFNQLQGLHQEWKETGPVAKELRDEIWNRFKAASTVVNKRHQAHFEALKAQEEENLAAKTALCEELEGMATEGLKSFADWDSITQKIIALQAKWKTIGYAPQKMNTQIFERFRTACDAFFEKKSQFFQRQKEELNANLARKKELVEKAEALKDSTEWRKTGDALIQLQKQWKEIGAVPRKYSETLWKRFIAACDQFFEAKQAATAGQREEEQGNLQQKQGIIEQLKAPASEGAEDVLQKVRELQQQWNEVGHVPFRDKDRLYKEYREICDKLYGALNATQARRRLNNFRNSLAQKIEKEAGSLEGERNRMMRAYERMRDEIKTYENNLGFLTTSSKKGNAMVDAMKKKVEKLREELHLLGEKIKAVDEEMQSEK
jgi:chromosome segregation ATPase